MKSFAAVTYYHYLSFVMGAGGAAAYHATPPRISPATNLPNQMYEWRGQRIRYQVAEPAFVEGNEEGTRKNAPNVLLIHGLFVNADHWRKTLKGLSEAGYRVYAMDMLGCGYSSKPPRDSLEAQLLCGERGRFTTTMAENDEPPAERLMVEMDYSGSPTQENKKPRIPTTMRYPSSVLEQVALGTANGGTRTANVDLRHPLQSPYNFFTWADQIADFCRDVIDADGSQTNKNVGKTTLVCNSVGTISSLQAAKDYSDLFNGVFIINPNFRELHTAEVPFPKLSMPFVRLLQSYLRTRGQGLFEALANPKTVTQILKEPYKVHSAIDQELVDVLLTPLLTRGASDVVFDTLSYSAGPLPEQLLSDVDFPSCQDIPVAVCYGKDDPWTPNARVERLAQYPAVEQVVGLDKVGHCPHDEAPELVNPLLEQFLRRIHDGTNNSNGSDMDSTRKTIMQRPMAESTTAAAAAAPLNGATEAANGQIKTAAFFRNILPKKNVVKQVV